MDDLLRPRLAAQRLLTWWAARSDSAATPPPRGRRTTRRTSTLPAATHAAPALTTQAVDVDALAAHLGLEVVPFHASTRRGGTLGWLEPGEDVIFLREALPEPVRRFTLAHELGHAILHRQAGPPAPVAELFTADPGLGGLTSARSPDEQAADSLAADTCDRDDLDAPLDPLSASDEALRPGQAYSARAHRESEANAFAAALLLPPAEVRALYLGDAGATGHTPAALAAHFGVSEDAVHQTLVALLLPPPPEDAGSGARVGGSTSRGQLDDWQEAAAAADTPALVVAGPGTGKTSTLVRRVAHLVFERGVEPGRILALTFSNKAAQEMRERVGALLAEEPGKSERPVPPGAGSQPVISTIHAFCGDLLRRYAPLVGLRSDFRLIAEAEGYLLLRQVASRLALNHYQPLAAPALHFPALLAAISRAKDELADPARYTELANRMAASAQTPDERLAATRALEVARVYTAYQDVLAEAGDADFGDVIRLAVRLLREHRDVLADLRARHTQVLVDEFQDINHAMGVLLRTLAGPDGPLWVVGDADQAIYRFRGASPANLARFTDAYPTARIYALGANYRSRPPILRAAAVVAESQLGGGRRTPLQSARGELTASDPMACPGTQSAAAGGPLAANGWADAVTVATAPDEATELAGLVEAIRDRVARGYALTDQAVLCRTRRQCQRVAAALTAAGLPGFVVTPLLDQPDVKDVLSVILLLADPSGAGLLRAGAIADHAFGRSDARAVLMEARVRHTVPVALLHSDTLGELANLSPEGRLGLARLGDALAELRAAPDVATGLARYVFARTGLARRALADARPESRLRAANLARVLVLARAFEEHRRATEAVGVWPTGVGAHWADFIDYVRVLTALGRESGRGADDLLAASAAGVRVLTVHASKGLEFPVVYLPGLAEGRFPTQRRADPTPQPFGLSEDLALEARDPDAHRAEEACLFYVAITRARDELVLSHAERYGRRRYQPSPFLKPLLALARQVPPGVALVRWTAAPEASPIPESLAAGEDEDAPASADVSPGGAAPTALEHAQLDGEALRPSAIETYQRCPRQYAYRYVYRLRPREIGLATLRRGLHETLRDLQERFAAPDGAGAGSPREPGAASPPTLAEARALFDEHWRAAAASSTSAWRDDPASSSAHASAETVPESDGPFGALYRRHGRRVVERAWLDLLRERGLLLPAEADVADGTPAQAVPDGETLSPAERDSAASSALPESAPLPLAARLEQSVQVRVGSHTIDLTLDRVDGLDHAAGARAPARDRPLVEADATPSRDTVADVVATPAPASVRFVRHRLGHGGKSVADLRSLLYALAAQQERGVRQPELFQHNLTTGELEPVRLDPRRVMRLHDELATALDGMESGVYPARPEPMLCQGCPFLLICPA